ncbi:hypothetical protein L228DRAFT_265999 [Xylona heveae TC161]|uniref:SH3 domain-containing protein n=1 Tax=Xylona heveae (strain CBS 132557 / TC161) TaxID=1328760 RepID=A0A165IY25_XYLHT|nr:hypothetical protein L228DRAFT_265999 [Xylona heveae TC161]KZF25532.1 hypothetical protein L228DRAFT_265999 [Xylona heveae TC161]
MSAPPFKVKAIFEYTSEHEDDLNFPEGQILTVIEAEEADWYFGVYTDASGDKKEGLFPRNFVEKYEPEPPPRPTRSRPKSHIEPAPSAVAAATSTPGSAEPPKQEAEEVHPSSATKVEGAAEKSSKQSIDAVSKSTGIGALPPVSSPPQASGQVPAPASSLETSNEPEAQLAPKGSQAAPKSEPVASTKPPPPAVAEKPAGSSFKDRIAAFNKPAAPPIAPFKPGGTGSSGASFIKKPFVAPPPSKDSFVPPPREPPPQKTYRREEDPEAVAKHEEASVPKPAPVSDLRSSDAPQEQQEDQPKPTTLKERIALLQKQQLEAQTRHAEAAQKKEKAKRPPPKKREESYEEPGVVSGGEAPEPESLPSPGTTRKPSMDIGAEEVPSPAARRKSWRSSQHLASPDVQPKEFFSDANDADQSAAGETTEDAGETSTGRDTSDEKPHARPHVPPVRAPEAPAHETDVGDEEDNADEEEEGEEEEEEDIDPEIKRRMEIRERMAKMSGGMGMHGMFGMPMGMPPVPSAGGATKKPKPPAERRKSEHEPSSPALHAPPVPIMPIPGMQRPKSPEPKPEQPEVEKEEEPEPSLAAQRAPEEVADIEDVEKKAETEDETPPPVPPHTTGRAAPPLPPVPHEDHSVPVPPHSARRPSLPPPIPSGRPAPPPPPIESRPAQPPPPPPTGPPLSPSAGSESDDELSMHARRLSLKTSGVPPPPTRAADAALSSGAATDQPKSFPSGPISPTTPPAESRRASRVPPPIPIASPMLPAAPAQSRPPPPPPPTGAPPSRQPTGNLTTTTSSVIQDRQGAESEEEESEYDGDYDTDIAPTAPHKDALKSKDREHSVDRHASVDSAAIPSQPPPPIPPTAAPPRAVPPPPPVQPPKPARQSVDMPRAPPPHIPLSPPQTGTGGEEDEEYDPFRYNAPTHGVPSVPSRAVPEPSSHPPPAPPAAEEEEEEEDLYSAPPQPPSSSRRSMQIQSPVSPPPAPLHHPQHPHSPAAPSTFPPPRQSLDVQRGGSVGGGRMSMDMSRPSADHEYIASDIDLGQSSQWWARPNMPPPVFQNRRDLTYEIEEASTPKRGGKTVVSKDVYVLFIDYSQTIITARFDTTNPSDVVLEQRHEPPPSKLRQDQLEDAHINIGQRISDAVSSKQNTIVGDGTPQALILDLFNVLGDAVLPPVGTRAYGAVVYANLANASVQQFDEIRPGDIVTFRNARFQGHKGTMHQKYNAEVGKPEHVGVVVDWDGTKKKVRAWEQGRENKKVKMESFRVADLRSGEVKVWRVMPRSWVGWGR